MSCVGTAISLCEHWFTFRHLRVSTYSCCDLDTPHTVALAAQQSKVVKGDPTGVPFPSKGTPLLNPFDTLLYLIPQQCMCSREAEFTGKVHVCHKSVLFINFSAVQWSLCACSPTAPHLFISAFTDGFSHENVT